MTMAATTAALEARDALRDVLDSGGPDEVFYVKCLLPLMAFPYDDRDFLDPPSKKALARDARTRNMTQATPPAIETRQLRRARERRERKDTTT